MFGRFKGNLLTPRRIVRYGSQRAEAEVRARTQYAYLGGGTGLCRVLGRFKMYVDSNDVGHSAHLIADGAWEMWVTRFLIRRMRKGMVAIDVGANLGYYTLLMAELVGPTGRVHAFEPNRSATDRLARSILANGYENVVTLHREAVGADPASRVRLVVPDTLPSGAWLVPAAASDVASSVPVRRLDSLPDLASADVVKIDAEGFEYEAWKGMAGLIAAGRPMLILLEFAAARAGHGLGFVDEMTAAGFSISIVGFDGRSRHLDRDAIAALPPDRDVMLAIERR